MMNRRLVAPDCESGTHQYVVEDCDAGVFIYAEPTVAVYAQEVEHYPNTDNWLSQVGIKIKRMGIPKDPDGNDSYLIFGVTKDAPPTNPYWAGSYHSFKIIEISDLPSGNTEYWFDLVFDPIDIEGTSAYITVLSNAEYQSSTNSWIWCGESGCNGYPLPHCLLHWNGSGWQQGVMPYAGNFYSCTQDTQYDPPTAVIDEPYNGATVTNPVHFEGHGISNAGGTITNYSWYDGGNPISEESSFDATLSAGPHTILFAVFCDVAGWSEWVQIDITVTGVVDCWECQTPGSPCVQTSGHVSCDGTTTFDTQAECEAATGCESGGTVSCWECQTEGEPCVQTSGHMSCDGTTTFTTKAACETATGCELGVLCEEYTTQSECKDNDCFWYAYPNPFGEPTCHNKEMIQAYIPIIAIGGGIALMAIALALRPKPYYPPMYQPAYYPRSPGR